MSPNTQPLIITGNVSQLGTLNIHQSITAEAIMAMQINHKGQQDGESISMPIPQHNARTKTRGEANFPGWRTKYLEGRNKSGEPRPQLGSTKVYVSRSPSFDWRLPDESQRRRARNVNRTC